MISIKRQLNILWMLLLLSGVLYAQTTETPDQKYARMAWWKDARLGLFIHWGAYAVPAGDYKGQNNYGEWIMYEAKIPKPEYEQMAAQLNPVQFNAEAWVQMAKDAGMKYIVITSKHHDGFSMFHSQVSDYDIGDRTPFQRDPLKELADACRRNGLKLCFYHSIMDWHHPDAKGADFPKYRDNFLKPQLRELLTNYGDIGVLWFDGEWIDEWTEEQGQDLYRYVRSLQPGIIVNNRVGKGRNSMQGMNKSEDAAGDFGTPEQEILGEKSTSDWESCMTMNDHWGYNKNDKNFKSSADLIWNIADITAKGGNYLLNVGPTSEGTFPKESIDRLKDIGQWTKRNAEAIYGTTVWEEWKEGEDIRYAQGKDGAIYAFVRNIGGNQLILKRINPKPASDIFVLGDNRPLKWKADENGVSVRFPEKWDAAEQPVWVLKIKGEKAATAEIPVISIANLPAKKTEAFTGEIWVKLSAAPGTKIFYTTDGSAPTTKSVWYKKPIRVNRSMTLKAIAKSTDKRSSETVMVQLVKAKYGVQIGQAYASKYASVGSLSLCDGKRGTTNFSDGKWLGFEGVDLDVTLDLGGIKSIKGVGLSCLRVIPSWIFLPVGVQISSSTDGKTFTIVQNNAITATATDKDQNAVETFHFPTAVSCRYVRIVAKNQGACPSWHPGSGAKAWLFVDEVWVD